MIKTPTLLLDEQKCKANIQWMADKALRHEVELRPHFKTHQSLEIGSWFKDVGVSKITVSSLTMASYFAEEWNDILIAFPTNINEIDTINHLASRVKLHLAVENLESIVFLSKHLNYRLNIYIQVDVGYHRTGIATDNLVLIDDILNVINSNSLLLFSGFFAHSGQTYKSKSIAEINRINTLVLSKMSILKKQYPAACISIGDTPTCSIAEDFTGIDEIRPGNFVFYDLMQHQIGSNTAAQIAVALACPIVAVHKTRSEIVIYGGGVHFSKDRLEDVEGIIYGRVVEHRVALWGNIIPHMYVKSLSQEHGIVSVPEQIIDNYNIGDHLLILPVHSCMTANLMKDYVTLNGRHISKLH